MVEHVGGEKIANLVSDTDSLCLLDRTGEKLVVGDWGKVALSLSEKLPLDHNRIGELEKVETRLIDEFFAAREQARMLLVNGKRSEAVELLDKVFRKQYEEAKKFMDEFSKSVDVKEDKK